MNNRPDILIIEIPKITEIRDQFNNLWFKVILSYDDRLLSHNTGERFYRIDVFNYRCSPYDQGYPILTYPERAYLLSILSIAMKEFLKYVLNYTSVVRASTREFLDMDVYKEKTGYKKSCAKCCATCLFCRRVPVTDDFYYGITDKLECWNYDNQLEYNVDLHEKPWPRHSRSHIVGLPPPKREREISMIHPKVEPFHVCDNWLEAREPITPVPGLSMSEFVDMRMNYRLDNRISNQISTALTSEALSVPVIQAVTMVLSSPEASIALEAPVVALMGAPKLCTATINVIGNALSTSVLSGQMITAVSSTFMYPEASAILEQPVAKAFETPTVCAATINVIGNALSTESMALPFLCASIQTYEQPEISDAMKTPVANVIPTPEVSGSVAGVIGNIDISVIYGIPDKNKNGKSDDEEFADMKENALKCVQDVVFGGLGA